MQYADIVAWGRWFGTSGDKRRVARTYIGDVNDSTVFLGRDHRYGAGAPLLYETMVFGGDLNDEGDRYSTRTEALEGHARMVRRVETALKDQDDE